MPMSAADLHAALLQQLPSVDCGLAVALSGGADSAALLTALVERRAQGITQPLRAVHVDHGLQAAAQVLRAACVAQCRALDVDLTVLEVHVASGGASLEAAAREARYGALAGNLAAGECLVTAHHLQDQAETLLLQLLRGAGLKGLAAMPARRALGRGWHLRPVLHVTQAELLALGSGSGSAPQSAADPMNDDLRFDRNFLRHEIWPSLLRRWPGALRALPRTARHLAEAQRLLAEIAADDLASLRDGAALSITGLRSLSGARRVNAMRVWLQAQGLEAPSDVRLREALRQMLDAGEQQLPSVEWGGRALRRYRNRLCLTAAVPPRLGRAVEWPVAAGAELDLGAGFGRLRWVPRAGGLDAARLPPSLTVRARRGGETLRPAAGARTQTLQHLCQEFGVLPWMRDALPVICTRDEVVAVADVWMDSQWCVASGPGWGVEWRDAPIIS
jgi:tRNA(Ile)-lysidine synthase